VTTEPERYHFTWAGKRVAQLRLHTPSRATLIPRREASINFDTAQHLVCVGDNLEVLKLLLPVYAGKIKLIYIDPPYNTGRDFVYADDFAETVSDYARRTGQQDEAGRWLTLNPETSGRYHSAWLSLMCPRLSLARQLLRDDGVIAVSIDDHELHHLRLLLNEIFGEECFRNCIIVKRGIKNVQAQFETVEALAVGHEYILLYARQPSTRLRHLRLALEAAKPGSWNNHWRGTDRPTMRYELFGRAPATGQWRWSRERSLRAIANYERLTRDLAVPPEQITQAHIDAWFERESEISGEAPDLLRLSATGKPEHYVPPTASRLGNDLWTDLSPRGSAELDEILGGKFFDNPKPLALIQRLVAWLTDAHTRDIVLDFFAGSGTTAQAVLELNTIDGGNRRVFLAQLPDPTPPHSAARQAGYATLADLTLARARGVLQKRQILDGFRALALAPTHFPPPEPISTTDAPSLLAHLAQTLDPLRADWQPLDVVFELLRREGFDLCARLETLAGANGNVVYQITAPDRDQPLHICLDASFDPQTPVALGLPPDSRLLVRAVALTDSLAVDLAVHYQLKTI
jgi:adenine-specific DNA-methyltransferase